MEQIVNGGSNRKYFRLQVTGTPPDPLGKGEMVKGESYIHVEGTSREENHAFVEMARHFRAKGLPVPEVYRVSEDEMEYDIEDLGDVSLFDYIAEGRKTGVFCEKEKTILRQTMRALARFQIKGDEGMDYSVCYPQPEFNERSITWDLNYFKYCFLKATGVDFQEDELENEFEKMARVLLEAEMKAFMYRDFQSRNVMVREVKGEGLKVKGEGEPWFIDFQGGRKGPIYYDVASFLWQAKANFHDDLRGELIDEYLDELSKYVPVDKEAFKATLKHFVLFRTLQVLGAYGFRGYFEKKPHFLQSIPFAIDNLRHLLGDDTLNYPYLCDVLKRMTEMKQFQDVGVKKPLVVRVFSFSYKKGIPQDESGNGGGFVFDCRAVNNPGKYDRYMGLTGMDEAVVKFIEDDGEMKPFLEACYQMVDASVKRYMDRGFAHLMVSFGCTGGQHRSVYGAEKMAQHIHEKFGVEVRIVHREQNIERVLGERR